MALKVIKPTWQQIGSGLAIEREGTVLLEFAKSTGPKSYAWDQKEVRGSSLGRCGAAAWAAPTVRRLQGSGRGSPAAGRGCTRELVCAPIGARVPPALATQRALSHAARSPVPAAHPPHHPHTPADVWAERGGVRGSAGGG